MNGGPFVPGSCLFGLAFSVIVATGQHIHALQQVQARLHGPP
jgi:hypothetical protein